LFADYLQRQAAAEQLNDYIQEKYPNDAELTHLAERLVTLEEE